MNVASAKTPLVAAESFAPTQAASRPNKDFFVKSKKTILAPTLNVNRRKFGFLLLFYRIETVSLRNIVDLTTRLCYIWFQTRAGNVNQLASGGTGNGDSGSAFVSVFRPTSSIARSGQKSKCACSGGAGELRSPVHNARIAALAVANGACLAKLLRS